MSYVLRSLFRPPSRYNGGGPDKIANKKRVVGAGHRSAQIGDYRKQEYNNQILITAMMIVGSHLGNTTKQITGNGLMYTTIKFRLTSSSVASLQGSGPVSTLVDVCSAQGWAMCSTCSVFLQSLEPNVTAFGLVVQMSSVLEGHP